MIDRDDKTKKATVVRRQPFKKNKPDVSIHTLAGDVYRMRHPLMKVNTKTSGEIPWVK